MNSNSTVFGVAVAGMSRTLDAQIGAHPAHPAHPIAAEAAAAPRKRRAAATAVASVRGFI